MGLCIKFLGTTKKDYAFRVALMGFLWLVGLFFQRTYLKIFRKIRAVSSWKKKVFPVYLLFQDSARVECSCVVVYIVFLMILQVNGIAFHPVHGTLATVGSDGRFSFWDKDARTKLKTSEQLDQPISACCFNHNGNIFAYASSYDWSKVRKV